MDQGSDFISDFRTTLSLSRPVPPCSIFGPVPTPRSPPSLACAILPSPLPACATGISLLAPTPTHPPLMLASRCQHLAVGISLLEYRFPTVTNCHPLSPLPACTTGTLLSTPHLLPSSWQSNSQFGSPGAGARHIRRLKDTFLALQEECCQKLTGRTKAMLLSLLLW